MNNNRRNSIFLTVLALMMLVTLARMALFQETQVLSIQEFYRIVERYEITDTVITPRATVIDVTGYYVEDGRNIEFSTRLTRSEQTINELEALLLSKDEGLSIADPNASNFVVDLLMTVVPYLILGGFIIYIFSKAQSGAGNNKAFEFGKSRAKIQGDVKVRYKDVAGVDEEKEEMKELIDYLKSPKKFDSMGARIPKGILLSGPPGTGKTLLAKATAGEADVPFFSISGSDFVEMFVGVGASRVRDMFKKAKATAPCIIFIDEIDAVGRQRGAGMGGGHDEREQTLNQILVEMDGIEENKGILIVAATNRADVLDPALLRPGRFDRTVTVSLPDVRGRTEILGVHARNKKLAKDINLENLARRTPGFSGADLENVLNEAAILAVRDNDLEIKMAHLDEAVDRVIAGPAKKSRKYSDKEKYMVAVHETGHTIIGLKLRTADKVQKVTIIPRGEAGGYNLMTPREEKFTQSKSDLLGRITGYLGGRVAEEIVFNEISTGAFADIQSATRIARAMVATYGMSNLGPIQYDSGDRGSVFLGRDYASDRNFSGEIAYEIDKEVRRIIDEAYEDARKIILENRELLDRIVEALMEFETLNSEQIQRLVDGKPVEETIDSDLEFNAA